jgi:hypothetical protein
MSNAPGIFGVGESDETGRIDEMFQHQLTDNITIVWRSFLKGLRSCRR